MRRNSLDLAYRCGGATLILALLGSSLLSCVDSESVVCPSGLFCPAGWRCAANGEVCIVDSCGDGTLQDGEVCDDGNTVSGDGCSNNCGSNESCGNGTRDKGEVCDDGNTVSGDDCSSDCSSDETCGNGHHDLAKGEKCDDGGKIDGDGCSADCLSDESCGNGIPDPGEVCDDNNNANDDACSADCKIAGQGCGNGQIDDKEECDDGGRTDENYCTKDCLFAFCGDRIISPQATQPEQCDEGGKETSSCNWDCTLASCGDGKVNGSAGEQCDSGQPRIDTRQCTKDCRISFCGDGYTNGAANEVCDDGNGDYCGTCSTSCTEKRFANKAEGLIVISAADDSMDGLTFTLDDGRYPPHPVTFEFVEDGWPDNFQHIPISLDGNKLVVAGRTAQTINHMQDLRIRAEIDTTQPNQVKLIHTYPTSYGNRPIVETVDDENKFKVEGMSGGSAGDCLEGVGCISDEDCAPGLTCQGKICRPR